MSEDRFLLAIDGRGIATLTLNRPGVANAYDEDLLRAMTSALRQIGHDAAVRQAGADINWGACFGRGVGIACCVDVALATPNALGS